MPVHHVPGLWVLLVRGSLPATLALVVGIVGVALGWVPLVGRFVALGCGVGAVVLGAVGMWRARAGARGSGYNLAVAGLALGCVGIFEGLRTFGCAAAGTAMLGLFS